MNDRSRSRSLLARLATIAGFAVFIVLTMQPLIVPAAAQNVCGPHADVLKLLQDRFAEAPVSIGLTVDGSVVELLSATDGATWTIVVTRPSGNSCVIAVGESWTEIIPVAGQRA